MKRRNDSMGHVDSPIPDTRRGRVIWLTLTVLFLGLLATALWLWVHTRADGGHRTGPLWQEAVETVAAMDIDLTAGAAPAAKVASYPSPFRPAAPETAAETDSEAETDGADDILYHGKRNDRMEIALSFDDGPHPRYTPQILEILAEYGVRATFFMVGENVTYYPAAAEAVVAAGHEIGNHTFSHRRFSRMDEGEMRREIAACEEAIASVADCRPHFIRPPEGCLSDTMRRVVGTLDYRIVLWDVDTRDWAHTPPAEICAHILDTVQAGDIILMHDFIGHDSPTPEALRLVIPALLSRGYRFVTVGELVDGR